MSDGVIIWVAFWMGVTLTNLFWFFKFRRDRRRREAS